MKTKTIKFAILAVLSMSTVLISCKKAGCVDSLAENYSAEAKEDDGTCSYARQKFIGSYSVTEVCSPNTYTYSITISESSNAKNLIVINNFGGSNISIIATVSQDKISFNETKSGVNVSGNGTISGSALTINYTASGSGAVNSCSKNCIKL